MITSIDKTHNYEKIARDNNIHEFCAPFLTAANIKALEFYRLFNDGSRIHLCTSSAWFDFFYTNRLYLTAKLERHPSCYNSGIYLWRDWDKKCDSYLKCGKLAEDYFNFANGLSVIRKNTEYCDIIQIAATRDNWSINEFYLHHIDLINQYIDYFLSDPADIIANAAANRIILDYPDEFNRYKEYSDLNNARIDSKIIQLSSLSNNLQRLTPRERQCILLLTKGKPVPKIAQYLEISPRTAEKYIINLKAKFDCQNLFQLGSKTAKLEQALILKQYIDSLAVI